MCGSQEHQGWTVSARLGDGRVAAGSALLSPNPLLLALALSAEGHFAQSQSRLPGAVYFQRLVHTGVKGPSFLPPLWDDVLFTFGHVMWLVGS